LYEDGSFWGLAVTQFLGAFNDNLFKQLILLIATPAAAALALDSVEDRQSEAQIIFAVAFLAFSGVAGMLADRISKRTVIVSSKVAEIVVMLAGMIGFYYYDTIGLTGMMCVLFLMGLQSTFFGPAKYGILPEMLRGSDLPRANGIFLMLTFLAIIFGMVLAGFLLWSGIAIWHASIVCVGIAIVGTLTALPVRRVPAVAPELKFSWRGASISKEIVALVRQDRELLLAIIVCALFWLLGGIVQQTVNALGKTQLGLEDWQTSLMAAMIAIGIAIGCPLGGILSRGRINARVVAIGAWGIVAGLVVMSLPGGTHQHLLGFHGSLPALAILGVFTGMFIVPVQVVVQLRPPANEKGRMIGLFNQCTWVGIILGAIIYKASIWTLDWLDGPRSAIFAVAAAIILPVAIFYRPKEVPVREETGG
jgi:acyl-[acyl-carrier-protein]-phospholipid O-acyltransferase/long-chain-fatty-acid--[acyl-carrier-protein] ligase